MILVGSLQPVSVVSSKGLFSLLYLMGSKCHFTWPMGPGRLVGPVWSLQTGLYEASCHLSLKIDKYWNSWIPFFKLFEELWDRLVFFINHVLLILRSRVWLKSFLMDDNNQFILCSLYHCCWWPGDRNHQGISSHGTDQGQPEYSSFITRRLVGPVSGLILGLHPANGRPRYFVTTSVIGLAQT